MVPQNLPPYMLHESHNALRHTGSTMLYNFIKRFYYWKKLHQDCGMYVRSCTECLQATFREPQYVNPHLPIPLFPMSFISMDLLGPYRETENGNPYAMIIYMLTNYVFMIPIKTKTTEDTINAYLKHVYVSFSGSKSILSDGMENSLANNLHG